MQSGARGEKFFAATVGLRAKTAVPVDRTAHIRCACSAAQFLITLSIYCPTLPAHIVRRHCP